MKNSLSKQERLKGRTDIEALFKQGERRHFHGLTLYYRFGKEGLPELKTGVGVSKRFFKHAVDRNLIKRRLREAFRTRNSALKTLVKNGNRPVSLFLIFNGREIPSYYEAVNSVEEAINFLLVKLKK